ncbi:unnamed protein product [Camellia sinensis]
MLFGLPYKVDGKRKRGESRSKTKPDQTVVPEEVNMKKVNYQSNITGLVKLLKDTKFTSGQLKCLRKTLFWPLFHSLISNEIDLNHCMKYDDVIVRIVETCKQSSGRFYIGDKNIQIFRSDVSLIFGVDCGTKSMDLSYGAKPTTGIIHRMCKDVSRLSAAKIREILREALKGTKKHDDEEVARLVCMYACVKLFFSTSGETIGWVFYSFMDPLHKMIEYDWAESIRATLMGSLRQNCGKPGRVTGCVMLLMYWLCEHTIILQPHNPNAIPRCVYGGELMASPTEAKMYRHTKLNVEPKPEILSSAVAKKDESNEDQSKDSQRSDDRDAFSVDAVDLNDVGHYINPSCSTPNAEKGIIIAQPTEPDIVEVLIKENQKAWALVQQWEAKYKQLEESWELRARVIAALEAKLFDQSGSSNVDMDMKTCMEWKDTEIQRLTKLVINLECEKTILQDLFDDQSVHIITQVEAQKAHDSLNKNPTAALEHIISPPSRVKRIKQKVRKEHRLEEFEYPNLPGQNKGKEGAEQQSHASKICTRTALWLILSSAVAKKDESNEDQSKDSQRSDDRDAFSVDAVDLNDVGHYINPSCSTPNAEKGIIIAQPTEPDIVEVLIKENQKAWALVQQWEAKYKQLEESWELRARVIAALEAKLFDQSGSSNVDMDMKTCMEWKDTEIQRLTKLVINLECEKTILQDLFDDQSVHIITQVEAQKAHDSLNKNPTAALEHIISPPSRVKRIKQKVRKEHRLEEFEYPNLPGQNKGKEGAEQQSHAVQIAQDLDKQPPKKQPTKFKKLTLNNKLKVWANMNKLNKQKVQNLHKNGGNELLVWRGDSKTKDVYFDDIIHIIKEKSITNNVIDGYGEILLELQGLVNPSLEDSSFIFTSTCLKIIEQYPPHKRNKLIDVHIKEYQGQRFLIFPIHDNFHWTIVVYDVKENVWRHYNSLRPREGIHDPHIDKAQILRDYITALVHNIGPSSPLWTNLSSQNTSKTIISVDICPQQASNS